MGKNNHAHIFHRVLYTILELKIKHEQEQESQEHNSRLMTSAPRKHIVEEIISCDTFTAGRIVENCTGRCDEASCKVGKSLLTKVSLSVYISHWRWNWLSLHHSFTQKMVTKRLFIRNTGKSSRRQNSTSQYNSFTEKMVLRRLFIGDTGEALAHSFKSLRDRICQETAVWSIRNVLKGGLEKAIC